VPGPACAAARSRARSRSSLMQDRIQGRFVRAASRRPDHGGALGDGEACSLTRSDGGSSSPKASDMEVQSTISWDSRSSRLTQIMEIRCSRRRRDLICSGISSGSVLYVVLSAQERKTAVPVVVADQTQLLALFVTQAPIDRESIASARQDRVTPAV